MKIFLLHGNSQTTTSWSGGTTTELFIYPDGATYAEKNFGFRISTADVIAASSNFTHFPGFLRKLMVLRGTMELNHKNQYTKTLNALDQDVFSGDWETSAIGRCMDYNLIHAPNIKGKIKAHSLEKGARLVLTSKDSFLFLYTVDGAIEVIVDRKTYAIGATDFLIIREPNEVEIEMYAQITSVLIETNIQL